MSLQVIAEMSNRYGADADYVLAGGGNTSFKDEKFLYIKPSGVSLAEIKPEDFVKLERAKVRSLFELPEFSDKDEREAAVKAIMLDAVAPDSQGRPSVEAPLHEIFEDRYVVHLHPALVNGMTCGLTGKEDAAGLFPEAMWVDYIDPGFTLAKAVYDAAEEYKAERGIAPKIVFLGNHGVFVGGDSVERIDEAYNQIMTGLKEHYKRCGVSVELEPGELDEQAGEEAKKVFEEVCGGSVSVSAPFKTARGPLSPDHLVYAKAYSLVCDKLTPELIAGFEQKWGYKPHVVEIPDKAVLATGSNPKQAEIVMAIARDGALVQALSAGFGGCNYMSNAGRLFIENWEVERYRRSVSQ